MQNADIQFLSQVQQTLSQNPDASQRDLASSTNLSLGMTNALLRRYSEKGWLYMKKISARNIKYALTSEGMNKLQQRSSQFFDRTARLMKNYKDIIYSFIKNSEAKNIYLVGKTDLDFLFDFACSNLHIRLQRCESIPQTIREIDFLIFTNRDYFESIVAMHNKQAIFIEDILRIYEYETV